MNEIDFCFYFQAYVKPINCLMVVAIMKAYDHVAFVRTYDVQASILEFFVPESMLDEFYTIIEKLRLQGFIGELNQLPNRYVTNG